MTATMTRPPRPEWTNVREMARELSVSKMTIYRLLHSGLIPYVRVGRSIRVKRTHWDLFLGAYEQQ